MTAEELCASCGACCDGTLFRRTPVRPGEPLPGGGIATAPTMTSQPCPAHVAGRCTIYASRPQACRTYECEPLRAFRTGAIDAPTARQQVALIKERKMPPLPPQPSTPPHASAPKFAEADVAAAAEAAIARAAAAAPDATGQLAALQRLARYLSDEIQAMAAEVMAAKGAAARAQRIELAAQAAKE